jgi:histidine ammonia-lyase
VSVVIGDSLAFEDIAAVALAGEQVELARGLSDRMAPARAVVEEAVASGKAVYGINTGIGDLVSVRIDARVAATLQRDLVRSHSTAVGEALPSSVVRAMLLLKARTFAFGVSGVRFDLVERLAQMLNEGIHPVVPCQGSLGASGDLALLAHLALPLIGEGFVEHDGRTAGAAEVLRARGIEPLELSHKEGLSLINGTEAMLALGVLGFLQAERTARSADVTGAMSVEACLGTDRAFREDLVGLRKHAGAGLVAGNLRRLLAGSAIVASHRDSDHLVQDAYSLRCIPQVHGAYRDAFQYVRSTLEAELASAVDNPCVMPATGEVLSGGNFHGEALGLALDHLGLCATGYSVIAERRVARLVDPHLNNGLPAFLTPDPGRRTGLMLAQYTAAALASENRSLSFPASSDTIPTSAGQEDHVSMGATSARKTYDIIENCGHVVAIEALAAAQALDMRPDDPAPGTGAARAAVRDFSPPLDEDRSLSGDISAVRDLVVAGALVAAAEEIIGPLDRPGPVQEDAVIRPSAPGAT